MTKHDSWVYLVPQSPFEAIANWFPNGFPVRDPWPAVMMGDSSIWQVDLERLATSQVWAFAEIFAINRKLTRDEILDGIQQSNFIGIDDCWVDRLDVGPEGMQRTLELANFLEVHPEYTPDQWQEFMADQQRRWIDGNEQPPPMPQTIDEVDPRLRTPEIEAAIEHQQVKQMLHDKGYSVFDVMMGYARADIESILGTDSGWELNFEAKDFEVKGDFTES
ncbi:hypothetical protein HC931_01140 [Candidatus Gracilibacteria bacterium]|nr:hypothetical protein [Candidatus Gracilibacteria bacterium]NJM87413.1 hypothetical protein [Hydrococcus sp. RU_2_2]NJP20835.1 hypothetical protein [Hydrococcus sp. CRU_1_1]NJQ96806.1 hypothetical protein [Hydrococcus sp. CSU_1_8]